MNDRSRDASLSGVDLYWLPLGAGDAPRLVRWSGRAFETVVAGTERRPRCYIYHSALEVRLGGERFTIEMAPVWESDAPDRGVMLEGPVGSRLLGRSRLFRYEVRRWRNGLIPDVSESVDSPQHLSTDRASARAVLDLVASFPTATWGRDEQHAGEMWNSNSLTSWLLTGAGCDISDVVPPDHGRAPGWSAGLVVAARAGSLARGALLGTAPSTS